MQFVIDKISEDSFYANILLGLPQTLSYLGIQDTYIARKHGVPESDIMQWEFKHGVRLTDDMRNFYAATDGFLYTWTLTEPDDNGGDGVTVSGRIEVNPLSQFIHLGSLVENQTNTQNDDLKLEIDSKIFELCKIDDLAKVVLVYINPHATPKIWLYTCTKKFYLLAYDFSTYMRMAIVHLGIPEWQFTFVPNGVSEACLELFQVLAPHLLPFSNRNQVVELKSDEDGDSPLNEIESDCLLYPKAHSIVSTNAVIDFDAPVQSRKQDKKKGGLKFRPPTKTKRKPLYYIKH